MASGQRTSRAAILAQIPVARAREARARRAGRRATAVRYDRRTGRVIMELTRGYLFGFPAAIPALAEATPEQLGAVALSPRGQRPALGGAGCGSERGGPALGRAGRVVATAARVGAARRPGDEPSEGGGATGAGRGRRGATADRCVNGGRHRGARRAGRRC